MTQTRLRRLLVANRGEIASRVFATCRRLGIETVAVYSDADAGLPFVREADVAVRLPGSAPGDTYLRGDLVVEAARTAEADAVHPGYGFLAESAGFARAVLDAGLVWVGPTPESIELMGSKVEAKKRMADAGVPVLADLDPAAVTGAELPVLVKASAGGGGRGMRVVRELGDLPDAVRAASEEAVSAFGDGTVFVEPYVERGRHVEVQVVGDRLGVVVHGDRDCSVQRRHQKVVEEAPAPGLSGELRDALHGAARRAAEAIDYRGAGTVEFLLDPATARFFFLEMNTRLQVEHPVTEMTLGVDLVAQQIAVAEGRPVAEGRVRERMQAATPGGHAVEARLYAEDPGAGWQPQSGRLTAFDIPSGPGLRVDAGYAAGSEVSTHYDAMLAKVVAHAGTREEAIRMLAGALSRGRIHGVATNRDLLVNVLRHEAFRAGDVSTDFLDRQDLDVLARRAAGEDAVRLSGFAAAVALAEQDAAERTVQYRVPVGWRNVVSQPHTTRFVRETASSPSAGVPDESGLDVQWYGGRGGYRSAQLDLEVLEAGVGRVVLEHGGVARTFEVCADGDAVDVESSLGHVALRRLPRFVDPAQRVAAGSLLAPMPGAVVSVAVDQGDQVAAGQTVLVLEAMKMQHTVSAPTDGRVVELAVAAGDQVTAGDVLAVVEDDERDPG